MRVGARTTTFILTSWGSNKLEGANCRIDRRRIGDSQVMHDQYIEGVIFGIPSFPNSIQFIQNLPSLVGEDQSEVESKK